MYDEQLHQMSASLAKDSIVTQALAKFLEQTLEVCGEHEAAAVAAMRAKTIEECVAIARRCIPKGYQGFIGDATALGIATAIAALKDTKP